MKIMVNNIIPRNNFVKGVRQNRDLNGYQTINSDVSYLSPAYFHPSFCAANPTRQLSHLFDYAIANPNKTDLIAKKAKHLDFEKIITSCITEPNHLGSGSFANIYRLDDNYCFKIYKKLMIKAEDIQVIDNSQFKDLKLWYGGVQVQIGNVEVLKNAAPKTKAVQVGVKQEYDLTDKLKASYIKDYLYTCEKLPQNAFDELANDFKTLNNIKHPDFPHEKAYSFDYLNPNNFIIVDNKIKIVDDIDRSNGQDLNNLSSMLDVLLLNYNLYHTVKAGELPVKQTRGILKKCLLACEKSEIALPQEKINKVERSFEFADLAGKWSPVAEKTKELRKNTPNIEKRVKLLGEYFDTL